MPEGRGIFAEIGDEWHKNGASRCKRETSCIMGENKIRIGHSNHKIHVHNTTFSLNNQNTEAQKKRMNAGGWWMKKKK